MCRSPSVWQAHLASLALLLDTNGPEWALDLSATLAGGTILEGAGANLNYGIHMAQSVLKGEGPLIAGVPPWHRMPGYGYTIAAGSITGDLLRSGLNSIFLQAGFVSLALALLVAAASRMAPLGLRRWPARFSLYRPDRRITP